MARLNSTNHSRWDETEMERAVDMAPAVYPYQELKTASVVSVSGPAPSPPKGEVLKMSIDERKLDQSIGKNTKRA